MLITISGCSCTGKSTLAKYLTERFPSFKIISLDSFAMDRNALLTGNNFFELNHDLPECYDLSQAYASLQEALEGAAISVPRYEYKTLKRVSAGEPGTFENIIFEGLYANLDERIRMISQLSIHLECDESVLLERRLKRDLERGVIDQPENKTYFENIALPTFNEFGRIQKDYVDLCFDTNDESIDHITETITNAINQHFRN